MSAGEILLWIILPYVAIATFVVGHWWRYRADQFGWTSRSTQLFEQQDPRLGRPGLPLRRARRGRRPRHRLDDPEVVHRGDRDVGEHLPVVLRGGRRDGRRGVRRRLRGPRLSAGDQRAGAADDVAHGPARLPAARGPDRAGLLDDVRAQPDHGEPVRLPRVHLGVVALALLPPARRRGGPGRQHRLSAPRDHRLGVLGAVPLQPPRPRVEHPAAVPRAAPTSSTGAATRRRPTGRDERNPGTAASSRWR